MQVEFEGSSLNIKKFLNTLVKYKWTNIFIILISLFLGLVYYYLKQPVYESTATIEVRTNPQENRTDFFGNAISRAQGTETEIDILRSEFLINKTLHSVDRTVDYFQKSRFKKRKIYKAPFKIKETVLKNNDTSLEKLSKTFFVKHIDQNRFELLRKDSFLSELFSFIPNKFKPRKFYLSKGAIYRYGSLINLKDCSFVVDKVGRYKRAEYSFSLNSHDEVVEFIQKNLSIKPASLKSTVLRLTYKDVIAKRAKDFLNAYVENYLLYSKRNLAETDEQTLEFINKQLSNISGKLEHSEDSLQGFKSSHNISDIDAQKKETIIKVNEFKEELKNAEVELDVIKDLYKSVKRGNYNSVSAVSKTYPLLNTMLQNLENTKNDRERKLSILTVYHPDVIALTKSINSVQNSIVEITRGIFDRTIKRVKSLKNIVLQYNKKLQNFPKIEQELVKHKRVFKVNDNVYNYLLKKQSEVSIEKASTMLNKVVLDYAKEPRKKLSPKLSLIVPTSLFLGFILALLHTMLRVKFDTKIKGNSDIQELTDIPIFGMIPFVKNKNKYNTAYVLDSPNSSTSESFRIIKNNLEYMASEKKSKVILVTSSVPNEGKTTVSANLAAILGMGEKRSIILSLDLRRPELHHKFKLSNKKGMSDVLANKTTIKDVTWESEQFSNFNIVTSGAVPPNPAELIASKKMAEVIAELRETYDYIILDTPPFEYVADALSLAKYADITLFVVKSEFSETKNIKEMEKLLKRVDMPNAGIVLNSVKSKHYMGKKFDYKYIYHEA